MNINYYIKQVYGKDTLYIEDEKTATIVKKLTGLKTLTMDTKCAMEELGFTFSQILKPQL